MTDPDIMDIVTMLRAPDRLEPHLCAAAADEIEQLRKDWKVFALSSQLCIDRLTAERDEARQRYCFAMAEHGEEAEAHQNAKDEGWDCFKENT